MAFIASRLSRAAAPVLKASVAGLAGDAARISGARLASGTHDLPSTTDFCVVGGGIIGIAVARELAARHPDASITLLEKESDVAQHASGRNSGVLHAGFYYSPESFKAKLTRAGNVFLHEYIEEKGLRINKCGKLVVARNDEEVRPPLALRVSRPCVCRPDWGRQCACCAETCATGDGHAPWVTLRRIAG